MQERVRLVPDPMASNFFLDFFLLFPFWMLPR